MMNEKIRRKLEFLHVFLPEMTDEQIIDFALLYMSSRIISILGKEGILEDTN